MTFTPEEREEIAEILKRIAEDGLPGPRDLDVAIDAIEQCIDGTDVRS